MKPNDGRYEGIERVPEVGDVVYVPSQLHLTHGFDDVRGGKVVVTAVEELTSAGRPALFVRTGLAPDTLTSWRYLEPQQAALAARFGDEEARPDPDDRPEFNDPGDGWPRREET